VPRRSQRGNGVKIIAVVGSGSGCGKTTVACRILRAIPGLGAVKISPRGGPGRGGGGGGGGGPGKDTDLYADSGAACVARIVGPRDEVVETWNRIKNAFQSCPGVVVEGSRSVDLPGERFVIFVAGSESGTVRTDREMAYSAISDVIIDGSPHGKDKIRTMNKSSSHTSKSMINQEIFRGDRIAESENQLIDKINRFLHLPCDG